MEKLNSPGTKFGVKYFPSPDGQTAGPTTFPNKNVDGCYRNSVWLQSCSALSRNIYTGIEMSDSTCLDVAIAKQIMRMKTN